MSSKSHATLLLLVVIGLTSACHKDLASLPTSQAPLLAKVTLTQYVPGDGGRYASSYPPILFRGTPYNYSFRLEQLYQYDLSGRLTLTKQTNVDTPDNHSLGGNESNAYRYVGNKVIRNSTLAGYDTLTIDQWGYAIANNVVKGNTTNTYDQNGYLLSKQSATQTTQRTINGEGNLTKEVIQSSYETATTEYEYDLTHLSLPDPLALFRDGKGSRHLATKSTTRFIPTDTSIFKPHSVSSSYSYEFDEQNRVKRQTSLMTNTTGGYEPILTIKDFVYSN